MQPMCDSLHQIFYQHIIFSTTDTNGVITNVSDAFCEETGYEKQDIIGQTHSLLRAPDFPDSVYNDLWETITQDKTWQGQLKNVRKDGQPYWVHSIIEPIFDKEATKIGYIAIRKDITQEKRCESIAHLDELTSIFNRRKFNAELPRFLENFKRYGDQFAVIMIDIDHFKRFNDNHGHLNGDLVLQKMAQCVQRQIRVGDVFARWGGEEFMLILNKADTHISHNITEKLLERARGEVSHEVSQLLDKEINISCSIGVTSPKEDDTIATLIKRVDQALYQANSQGRDQIIYI